MKAYFFRFWLVLLKVSLVFYEFHWFCLCFHMSGFSCFIFHFLRFLKVPRIHNIEFLFYQLYQGDPNQWGPIDSPFGRVELIGGAD